MTVNVADNRYGVAQFIVAPTLAEGANYTTIASALTAASSGQTIFIRPGTYTENLTLKAGVNLVSFYAEGDTPNVTIVGNCTATFAGTATISGIRLQTNSANFLTVSGSAATIINLQGCYLNCSNNTGISFSTSSSSARIFITQCKGNLATTGIAYWSSSSAGGIFCGYSQLSNTGASTTASSCSAGFASVHHTEMPNLSCSSAATVDIRFSVISATNTTGVALTGTGSSSFYFVQISSGTGSAIDIGSGTTAVVPYAVLSSSNANCIAGSGTLQFGVINFTSADTIQGTITTNAVDENKFSRNTSPVQPAFFAYKSSDSTNQTGNGATATVICDTEVIDQGSHYNAGTGVFTAPVTGFYQFSTSILLSNMGAAALSLVTRFELTGSALGDIQNRFTCGSATTNQNGHVSAVIYLVANDTVGISITVNGMAGNTVTVEGSASYDTIFSGALLF